MFFFLSFSQRGNWRRLESWENSQKGFIFYSLLYRLKTRFASGLHSTSENLAGVLCREKKKIKDCFFGVVFHVKYRATFSVAKFDIIHKSNQYIEFVSSNTVSIIEDKVTTRATVFILFLLVPTFPSACDRTLLFLEITSVKITWSTLLNTSRELSIFGHCSYSTKYVPPPPWLGCDTRSIFMWSLFGLTFSQTRCHTKVFFTI